MPFPLSVKQRVASVLLFDFFVIQGLTAGYFVYACGFVLLKWNWTS